jgi:uncharacterized protein
MATIPAKVHGKRITTLDIVRGVAVMGILAMNIVAFAMPFQAYFNPTAFGADSAADYAAWLVSFVFVDGKMRGLFSLLFGASMLLVIERAEASGARPKSVHFRRMFWLLLFGLLHLYFIWFGDILALYAMVGMIAWLFRRKTPRKLIGWGIAFVIVQFLIFAGLSVAAYFLQQAATQPGAAADVVEQWQALQGKFGPPSGQPLNEKLALFQGAYGGIVESRVEKHGVAPIISLVMMGWETLGYFLFGMAAFKTGFLTGGWAPERYRKWALVGFGISVPAYAVLAWVLVRDGFTVPTVLGVVMAATIPFRPAMILGYAALIILATRRGDWLVDRIAAAGRAAFTNYLGTSIIMTSLFYGYGAGLYGSLGRAELWLVVIAMWVVMLAWSKPWLDRFNYGPFEWAWRSLARWRVQPMRKRRAAEPLPAGA